MNRRDWIIKTALLGSAIAVSPSLKVLGMDIFSSSDEELKASQFGSDFVWGTATAAFQVEGATNEDGKQASIWDVFSHKKGKIHDLTNADQSADFYHKYASDLMIAKEIGAKAFRFSISWPRIVSNLAGKSNPKGIEFYDKVINQCLTLGLEPWIMLYHWDLPQYIEDIGGWTNRTVIDQFANFVDICTRSFGDRVKNWLIINEPLGYTGFGYMTGQHAPGRRGLGSFLAAVHHTAMCQAEGGRIVRRNVNNANIGTSFSCSPVDPYTESIKDKKAAKRLDALLNRLFIEPTLGMGYPVEDVPFLRKMKKNIQANDMESLAFDFDFIGLQNYFRVVCKHNPLIPFIQASEVTPAERKVPMNELGCEINPEAIYRMIKQYNAYPKVKKIIITENGVCVPDKLEEGAVHDKARIDYIKNYLTYVLKAKREGAKVGGYFVWSLLDNFEWAEGFKPRFGLIFVDFKTQKRVMKDSAYWYKHFLEN